MKPCRAWNVSRSLIGMILALSCCFPAPGHAQLEPEAKTRKPADIIDVEDVMDWILQHSGAQPYPSQVGAAGWPGADRALGEEYGFRGNNWGWPEMIPYPGSVEHTRVWRQRYLPVYPLNNARTLVKAFRATELPGIRQEDIVPFAEPIYHVPKYRYPNPEEGVFWDAVKLDKVNQPVQVLRFDRSSPPLTLALGSLRPGAYAVRIIAAAESERVQQSTRRLVIHFEVNDGPDGEVNAYKKRCGVIDEFYSMAEFFFVVTSARECQARIWVDASSMMPILVHTIDLHDRLAELPNRAAKKTAALYDENARAAAWQAAGGPQADTRGKEERFAADERIMAGMLPANIQPRGDKAYWAQLVEAIFRLPEGQQDDGMGIDLYGSDMIWNIAEDEFPNAMTKDVRLLKSVALIGQRWNFQRQSYYGKAKEIGLQLRQIVEPRDMAGALQRYADTGDETAARTAAMLLARIALANYLNMEDARQQIDAVDYVPELGPANQGDMAFRRRTQVKLGAGTAHAVMFDTVFPYIRGNADLAESLRRFIPWITGPEELARFFEVGLLQIPAREMMLYQRHDGFHQGAWMTTYIVVQQDEELIAPWMHWLFRFVYAYPSMPTGIDETLFTSWTNDGTTVIGSTFYTIGTTDVIHTILGNLAPFAKGLHGHLVERLNLPEVVARYAWESRFSRDAMVAGGYRFWVGNVSGPSRPRWVVSGQEKAEDKVDAHNASRVLPNWFGILESNIKEPDFRRRQAAGIRVGNGLGHAHNDPLDLQIWSLGVPLSGDWGARGGYCVPESGALESHNTVVAPALLPPAPTQHRWASGFAATAGAQYIAGQVRVDGHYGRQVIMVDIDEPVVSSYVVDIFRVRGGDGQPAYAFHGPPPDEFFTNIETLHPGWPQGMEAPLLDPDNNWHGTIEDHFTADWLMGRDSRSVEWKVDAEIDPRKVATGTALQIKDGKLVLDVPGAEMRAMGPDFNVSDPRKHIRLHLLGHGGATAYGRRGFGIKAENFINDMLYVLPAQWQGQTVYPVVFEPHTGDERPMRRVRLLTPKETLGDVSAPVAVEVTLANGRRDVICTALPGAEPVDIPNVGTIAAEYAFLSWDAQGLRQATLVGGTLLTAENLSIRSPQAAYEGIIADADPNTQTLVFSEPLPKEAVGDVLFSGPATRPTSCTIASIDGKRAVTEKDFTLIMSRVAGFLDEDGMPFTYCKFYIPEGVAISNESRNTWWISGEAYDLVPEEKPWPDGGEAHPVEVPPRGRAIRLGAGPEPKANLRVGERLWAYQIAKGNHYRLPIKVTLVRAADGTFSAEANIDAVIEVAGKRVAPKRR